MRAGEEEGEDSGGGEGKRFRQEAGVRSRQEEWVGKKKWR